ncbi:hypothetical protein DYBT9275_02155 [Dyadobacter sp. CECT 9275]|uniref:Uncharacterized protein n=1 Tax=Dyadobacter helix TaxID=2822344 RepID=A0A916JBL7_9BACT|nr:hypothetical protein [Dyadobacter sp. CECT 9275]CAG4999108.1 hypothetical protein DYBT9275_02155 [Dyadobacter sp. CECT 9275]
MMKLVVGKESLGDQKENDRLQRSFYGNEKLFFAELDMRTGLAG